MESLPVSLPPSRQCHIPIRVLKHENAIPVSYEVVRGLIPTILESKEDEIDVVLHIGMATGRRSYDLECCAGRRGYKATEDTDGHVMRDALFSRDFSDCAETLVTTMDCDEILRDWRNEVQTLDSPHRHVDMRKSEEAGGYLCEYILYNSLAWYARRDQIRASNGACNRPVLFLHVPAGDGAPDVETGREITLALLRAVAQSWSISKRYLILLGG
jgi:pyroglutamyl-peptidase